MITTDHEDVYLEGYDNGYRIGWLEAAIDGEGWLGLHRYERKDHDSVNWIPTFSIGTTDYFFIEKFSELCGASGGMTIQEKFDKRGGRKTMYRVSLYGSQLRHLLKEVSFVTKEKQRLLLLEVFELLPGYGYRPTLDSIKRLDEITSEIHALNKKGVSDNWKEILK